jgi:hypothetical protein
MIVVPKRSDCARNFSMSSGPRIPPGKPGKFSTADSQKHRRRSGIRIDESGEVWILATRTIGSCGQLTAGGKTVRHETFEKHRVEVSPSQVDGGGMSCRSRANDNLWKRCSKIGTQAGWEGKHTTLECIFELLSFLPMTGAI